MESLHNLVGLDSIVKTWIREKDDFRWMHKQHIVLAFHWYCEQFVAITLLGLGIWLESSHRCFYDLKNYVFCFYLVLPERCKIQGLCGSAFRKALFANQSGGEALG